MASILTAISSAGMRSDVWNQWRAAPKIAQAVAAESFRDQRRHTTHNFFYGGILSREVPLEQLSRPLYAFIAHPH